MGRKLWAEIPVQWTETGRYRVDELRSIFIDAVDHDDDSLTQFVEAEELTRRLAGCDNTIPHS